VLGRSQTSLQGENICADILKYGGAIRILTCFIMSVVSFMSLVSLDSDVALPTDECSDLISQLGLISKGLDDFLRYWSIGMIQRLKSHSV